MRLSKIYTRTGDAGTTRLANGDEVSKDDLRVCAYGDIDELNSLLGLVISQLDDPQVSSILLEVQHHLFDAGGEIASAGMVADMITDAMVTELEHHLDQLSENLPPLKEFILPGGTTAAAYLHVARTVCRRVERSIIKLDHEEAVAPVIIRYINRLSDLLFVMARYENHRDGTGHEIYWRNLRS